MQHAPCAHLGHVSVVLVRSSFSFNAIAIAIEITSLSPAADGMKRHTALVDEHVRRLLVRIRLEVIESGGEEG